MRTAEKGAALIVILALIGIAFVSLLVVAVSASRAQIEKAQQTEAALGRAREALIAYAVSVSPDTSAKRPGDLPCPDLDNDGSAEATCPSDTQRIGRLPWKTLDLGDLRDGDGERLWYALSGKFDRTTVNQCPTAGGAGCLNSETYGTITVRAVDASTIHDGTNPSSQPSGAIAVVISPGAVLKRMMGASGPQDRGCTGDSNVASCNQTGICTGPVFTATARCNPTNFLDVVGPPVLSVPGSPGSSEDNANFADATTTDGFIQGPIWNSSDAVVLNDRVIVLRYEDLMPHLERRVAAEALRCLQDFATDSSGRYPWAAPVAADYSVTPLADEDLRTFGRLPDTLPASMAYAGMAASWRSNCPIGMSAPNHMWWANWRNLAFFGIAPGYAPDQSSPACGTCLTVDPPSPGADKHVVVLVAGWALSGQIRGVGASETAYLEDANATGGTDFKQAKPAASFNDFVLYQ